MNKALSFFQIDFREYVTSNCPMRFYMLDRIVSMEKGKSINAIKCWTQTDDVFNDHFPTLPIVPGVLIIEAMSQALGVLLELSYPEAFPENKEGVWSILTMIQKAKFKKFSLPGDRMEIKAEIQSLESSYGKGLVSAHVDGELRAQAEISLAFLPRGEMKSPELIRQRENYLNFLFNGHKLNSHQHA
jgi:3-hydroxyacyl-[acyl-carrier-protein] dehydratase